MNNIHKDEIDARQGLRVLRLSFDRGASLKPHHATSHVVVVCTRGSGRWLMNGEVHPLTPGVALSVPPLVEHAVEADDDLEVIITHADLAKASP